MSTSSSERLPWSRLPSWEATGVGPEFSLALIPRCLHPSLAYLFSSPGLPGTATLTLHPCLFRSWQCADAGSAECLGTFPAEPWKLLSIFSGLPSPCPHPHLCYSSLSSHIPTRAGEAGTEVGKGRVWKEEREAVLFITWSSRAGQHLLLNELRAAWERDVKFVSFFTIQYVYHASSSLSPFWLSL